MSNKLTGVTKEQSFVLSLNRAYTPDSTERRCIDKLFTILRKYKGLKFRHAKINEEKRFYIDLVDIKGERLEIDETWCNCIKLCNLVQAYLNDDLPVIVERLLNGNLQVTIQKGKQEEVQEIAKKYGEDDTFKVFLNPFNYAIADFWIQEEGEEEAGFIILHNLITNDSGEMKSFEGEWYFPRYKEIRAIDELLNEGTIIFEKYNKGE